MRAFGVDMDDLAPCVFTDKVERGKRGPNAGTSQLEDRNYLLKAVRAGDSVLAAHAYCLGISPDDVAWFAGELSARGVTITVAAHRISPGDDLASLLDDVGRKQNAVNVAAHRKRKSS